MPAGFMWLHNLVIMNQCNKLFFSSIFPCPKNPSVHRPEHIQKHLHTHTHTFCIKQDTNTFPEGNKSAQLVYISSESQSFHTTGATSKNSAATQMPLSDCNSCLIHRYTSQSIQTRCTLAVVAVFISPHTASIFLTVLKTDNTWSQLEPSWLTLPTSEDHSVMNSTSFSFQSVVSISYQITHESAELMTTKCFLPIFIFYFFASTTLHYYNNNHHH